MLKISYFPMVLYSNKPSYIWCDEDVLDYLMQVNHDKCKSVLHVEISSDMDDTYGGLPLSGDDDGTDDSYVGLSDGEDADTYIIEEDGTEEDGPEKDGIEKDGTEQDVTDQDHEMDGVVTLYTAEQHEDFEMHGNLEHGYEGAEVRVEVEAAIAGVEATTVIEEEWDDGLDLVKGQELRTKTAMQVLVQRGAHKNGFDYETTKFDTVRFVAKCREPKKVASGICKYDTPTPNDMINMVTCKVGVDVSYATHPVASSMARRAWRKMVKLRVVFEPLQLRLKLFDDLHCVAHIELALYLTRLRVLGVLEA
ncbi:hypothetical protein N665_0236s0003 [Sinapis alba]|nr:hypothetical protein N665_0236s0003 [Sinapis alba]